MSAAGCAYAQFATALMQRAPALPPALRARPGTDTARRFDVHRNNTMAALTDALSASFPVTHALVGERFFRAMAAERVRVDPPRSPVLIEYGEGFAAFIDGFAPAAGVPYLADVARLENARVRAFHAADAAPVEHAEFALLLADPVRLAATRLRLHPACAWLRSPHAIHAIWAAHRAAAPGPVDLGALAIDSPQAVLIARPALEVIVEPIHDATAAALAALHAGATLAEAAAGHASDALVALLTLVVRHGLAVSLSSPPES